jgi:hypothetical protein
MAELSTTSILIRAFDMLILACRSATVYSLLFSLETCLRIAAIVIDRVSITGDRSYPRGLVGPRKARTKLETDIRRIIEYVRKSSWLPLRTGYAFNRPSEIECGVW